jgi:hypothetical protein
MSRKFLTGVDLANQRATNVASPAASTDAANRQYVDDKVNGLSWKDEVRAATTTAGTISTGYAAGQVIDGVTLATGDRILIKDQATATENGIYTVNASGAPTRATDADTTAELNNATVKVTSGTTNANGTFTQTFANPVVGTSSLTFVAAAGGTTYTAGTGLTLTGSSFAVDPNYTGLAKRYAVNVPTTGTTVTITHALGTTDVTVAVYDISTANSYLLVEADVTITGVNTLTLGFAVTPTTGQYRVVVTA